MINNPKLIEEIKEKIRKLSKKDLEETMKIVDEWYDTELDKCINRFDRKEVENLENRYPRYINVLTIIIFNCKFSFEIGNPLWFIQEFKNLKEVE